MKIFTTRFYGLQVSTGDILCTRDGEEDSLFGRFWRLLGRLVPGEVDHCLIYLGPGGRCVESGPRGVIVFDMPGEIWDPVPLVPQRLFLDTFFSAAYPLAGMSLNLGEERRLRSVAAEYCLEQAAHAKPYNLNFFDPLTDGAFYCSQLVYKAYLAAGLNLMRNSRIDHPAGSIVFPQEIYNACRSARPEGANLQF